MHASMTRRILVLSLCMLFIFSSVCVIHDLSEYDGKRKSLESTDNFDLAIDIPIWNHTYDGEGKSQDDRGYSLVETSDGGFVAAGEIKNTSTFKLDMWVIRVDANGTEVWNTTIDNGDSERAWDIVEVSTGGFAVCGYVRYAPVATPYNFFYLVKLDNTGNVDWARNYTGMNDYEARALTETDDGGFILVGRGTAGGGMYVVRTDSVGVQLWDALISDGDNLNGYDVIDLTGTNGYVVGCTMEDSLSDDFFYLLRLDESGNHVWNSTHGGSGTEYCFGMTNTTDGGYLLCGTTSSWGSGGYDMYLVKFDGSGNLQWNQTYGGTQNEMCQSVTNTADGGFSLAGYKAGADDDIWVVRTDSEGEVWWTEQIHYAGDERADKIVEVYDGGYAITGYTNPSVGDWNMVIYRLSEPRWDPAPLNHELDLFEPLYDDINATSTDGPLQWSINDTEYLSIDSSGVLQNTSTLPVGQIHLEITVEDQHGHWIQKEIDISVSYPLSDMKFNDGQRVIGKAITEAPNGDLVCAFTSDPIIMGDGRTLIVRYNSSGEQVWDSYFPWGYYPEDIITCSTGGYIVVGIASSTVETDDEFWILKIDEDGNHVWNSTFRKLNNDRARSVVESPDGGFLMLGQTYELGGDFDFWLIRTDSDGNHLWNKTYGISAYDDEGYSITAVTGGGYALAGYTDASASGNADSLLICIDESGNQLWNMTYGGSALQKAYSVIELGNGGFGLTGTATYGGLPDAFVILTNETGHLYFTQMYGGDETDYGEEIVQLHNDSIVIAGRTQSFSGGNQDGYFILIDGDGNLITNESIGSPADSEYFADVVSLDIGGIAMIGRHTPFASISGNGWIVVKPLVRWTQIPSDQISEFGTTFSMQLHATSAVRVMHWWINDTTNFSLSDFGVLTNQSTLGVDDYGITVRVYDHAHNMIQESFTVTVVDTTEPTWVIAPEDQEIDYLESFSYQLEAYDLSTIVDYHVNDTTNFSISDDGLITNNTILAVGTYGLEITVFDGSGNILTGTFTVTVLEVSTTTTTTTTTTSTTTSTTTGTTTPTDTTSTTTPPPDMTLILVIIAGVGAIVVIVIIIFLKKQSRN